MTDRELLELSAKAAGLALVEKEPGHDGQLGIIVQGDAPLSFRWNPLEDDGDALRLAVRLGIPVDPDGRMYEYSLAETRSGETVMEKHGGDPYAATRRVIVRAAAEIGKQQK